MEMREARSGDAQAMSDVLQELIAAGRRSKAGDAAHVRSHYLEHPRRLSCLLAFDEAGDLLGFQSLKRADSANPYGTPVGWGIIGTHIRPSAARKGVGSRLFAATVAVAAKAKLPAIEAFIGDGNTAALGYYESLGFRTCRHWEGATCKAYAVGPAH